MRGFLAGTVLVLALLATGCGGGGGGGGTNGGGTNGGGTPSGEASKPAATVLADAVKAANAASSVHISGQVSTGGKEVVVDLSIAKGKGATGSMTLGGAKIDLVVIGKKGYLKAGADFWNQFSQASGFAGLLSGKWLAFPADNAQFGSLTGVANAKTIFNELTGSHGKIKNTGATTYNGQSVIALVDETKHGTLYVAGTGAPYPAALVETKGGGGTVTFDRWNESVTLTAPKGAIDFSHLGG